MALVVGLDGDRAEEKKCEESEEKDREGTEHREHIREQRREQRIAHWTLRTKHAR